MEYNNLGWQCCDWIHAKDEKGGMEGKTGVTNSKAVICFAEHASMIRQSGDLLLLTVMMTEQPSVFVFGTVDIK